MTRCAIALVLAWCTPARGEDWSAWRRDTKKYTEGRFTWHVHTPPGYDAASGRRHPLLVVLHWSFVDGPAYLHYWRPDADARGVIVAAPTSWGGGSWLPSDASNIEHMVEDIKSRYAVDEDRIWVAGYSAGGVFVYYLLFKHPDLFDAALPVGGRIRRHRPLAPTDTAPRHTRLCVFHGEWDKNIHFEEAEGDVADLRRWGYPVELHRMARFGHWIPRDRGPEMFDCLEGRPAAPAPEPAPR